MKQFDKNPIIISDKDIIYPIYQDTIIDTKLCEQLDFDVNSIVDKELNSVTVVYTLGKLKCNKLIFLGLGNRDSISTFKMYHAFKKVSTKINTPSCFYAKSAVTKSIDIYKVVELFCEVYWSKVYKQKDDLKKENELVDVDIFTTDDVSSSIQKAMSYAKGIYLSKKLANTPSNLMTPSHLVEESIKLAKQYSFEYTILDKDALIKMGAGGILSVNQGSDLPAYMICLKYTGDTNNSNYTALIGKGITFDTGGYNIKPNSFGMKYDMCGAADVLGTMQIIGELKPKVNVYAIIPTTENLINGSAYKPEDVITTLSKKTVEIVSTDAEGRLILCDAITYAQSLPNVNRIIDIATLTGACVASLGNVHAGIFSNNDDFYGEFEKVLKQSDEKGWRLPIDDEYFKMLDSNTADMKNSSRKAGGGASVAAVFLKQFINKNVQWIHIDIAGVANSENEGATGTMVRTLANFLSKS